MKTALQELIEELKHVQEFPMISGIIKRAENLLGKEKEQMIDFYNWMRRNDSSEEYFHYSDEDMLEQYFTKNK